MDHADRAEFGKLMVALAGTWQKELDELLLAAYATALEDVPMVAIRQAAARAMRESKYMPAPAVLRELAGELAPDQRALVAWSFVEMAVRQFGSYQSIDFDDPVINATIRTMGGWVALCETPAAEFDRFAADRFVKVYRALFTAGCTPSQRAHLPGLHETDNRLRGFAVAEPVKMRTSLPAPPQRVLLPGPREHKPIEGVNVAGLLKGVDEE